MSKILNIYQRNLTLGLPTRHSKIQLSLRAPKTPLSVSNPLSTQAGSIVQYLMNVTMARNLVNIRTGIVNTTVTGTMYSDNQLAVYQMDRVLLPLSFFVSLSPVSALSKPVKKAPFPVSDELASSTDASVQASGDVPHRTLNVAVCFAGLVIGYKPKAKAALGLRAVCVSFSTELGGGGSGGDVVGRGGDTNNNNSSMSFAEAKKLMRLVNVEALKMKLGGEDW